MIDKLVLLNKHTLLIVYTNKAAVTLHSDESVLELADWLFTPSTHNLETFAAARSNETEQTCSIILNAA